MAVYADDEYDGDSSETNTGRKIKQNNVGSCNSTNFNCADNDLNVVEAPIEIDLCGTAEVDIGEEDVPVTAAGAVIPTK